MVNLSTQSTNGKKMSFARVLYAHTHILSLLEDRTVSVAARTFPIGRGDKGVLPEWSGREAMVEATAVTGATFSCGAMAASLGS